MGLLSSATMSLDGYIGDARAHLPRHPAERAVLAPVDRRGRGGRHPVDLPVVVVSHSVPAEWVDAHRDAPFTFVTEGGVAAAVEKARELAGDKNVDVAAGRMATQALELDLLDEIQVDVAPVVMGRGKPYFGSLNVDSVLLEDPTTVIQSTRALHLVYPVRGHRTGH